MKKLLSTLILFFFLALPTPANDIDKYIFQSNFEFKSVVSVYVKNLATGEVLYKKNEKKLLNPASMLKTLTFGVSKEVLGSDYKFETAIYKDKASNNLYLKLGADPLLTSSNLEELFKTLKTKIDTSKIGVIYIDDSIIDKTPYPKGWMNDDMWPTERALTPYIVDNNITSILIKRSSLSTRTDIIQNDDYKFPIINELKLQDKNPEAKQDIKIVRKYDGLPIINLEGTLVQDEILKLPVLNPELNFKIKAYNAISKAQINYDKKFFDKKVPQDAVKLASVSHSTDDVAFEILHNSNNFVSEIVFKVAGAKYINYSHPASTDDAIKMFNSIIKQEDIKITDASGVSRYDTLNTESLIDSLLKLNAQANLRDSMATSGQGTLKTRLSFLENNLKAKTGTLSKMSSICGFLTTSKNKDIAFAIIVQNSPKRKAILKNFEDNLITILYRKY